MIVGNGDFLPITHVGSIALPTLSGTVPLNDVLVCPSITKSLLSVSKLTDDYPCEFTFDSRTVVIKDKQSRQLLTRGSKHEGLYRLENPQFLAFYSSRQQSATDVVWHKRLGHPHQQVLQFLSTTKAISVNKVLKTMCESCQLGKTSKLPFSSSVFESKRPLERIHCDVWGPAPVTSVQGFRYYVIFIDNFSRFAWFYPIKLKSDVFTIFKSFQSLVETQIEQKIQIFQSDGGGEFVNAQFMQHLSQCGIKHYLSRPHTPQQNGLAERKHRHLLELGMSMLFEARLPHNLWVEALFTANFLSNLLPTSVHDHNTTPFQKLNGVALIYTALRVFGCACYPYLRPYAHNKFDPKSLLCVFLGYTEKYKGYRCLHPPTGRVYLSRHVLFDEERFPYADVYKYLLPTAHTPLLAAWYKGSVTSSLNTEEKDQQSEEPVLTSTRTPPPATVVVAAPAADRGAAAAVPAHIPAPAPFHYNEAEFPPLPSPEPVQQQEPAAVQQ